MARLLHVSRQLLHYHIKKWLHKGWIKRVLKTPNVTLYQLTSVGKKFVTGGKDFGFKGGVGGFGGVRLHAFGLKFPVLREPGVVVDWRRVEVAGGHWCRLVGREGGLTVEKTSRHVIVHADEVLSDDPNEAVLLAFLQCVRLALLLEEKFDMKLGIFQAELLRPPHYGVYSPVAEFLTRFMEFSDDLGKMDRSEGYGEIDCYSPQLAKEHLIMPLRVMAQERVLGEIRDILQTFGNAMHEHMTLIKALQAVAERMDKALQQLTEINERG